MHLQFTKIKAVNFGIGFIGKKEVLNVKFIIGFSTVLVQAYFFGNSYFD